MLAVDLVFERGTFTLTARFQSAGRVTALFGSSGAGKSTLASVVAGLERPTRGRVVLDDAVLLDTAAGIDVATHRRRIGMVFQNGRLFPHLTVRQNLGYGRWFANVGGRGNPRPPLEPVVDLLGIGPLLDRRPATLSGGEQQRVAIGRALLARPRLLVLDEPLSALDQPRRAEILPYLRRLRDELALPMIYISHALDEIVQLADSMVLLNKGEVAAAGPIDEVIARLDLGSGSDRAEAGTVIEAEVAALEPAYGLALLRFAGGSLRVPAGALTPGQRLRVHIRARDVAIALQAPRDISMLNVLPARIVTLAEAGETGVILRLDVGGAPVFARVTRLSADRLGLRPGLDVQALIKSVAFERPS